MTTVIENLEGLKRRLSLELSAEKIEQAMTARLSKLKNSVRIDGFRPGKVPETVVRQRYGDAVRQEVIGEQMQSTLAETLQAQQVRVAGRPNVEMTPSQVPGANVQFSVDFEVYPEINLSNLKDLTFKKETVEITDADIDAAVLRMRESQMIWQQVDRPAQLKDRVTVDFVGSTDEGLIEGGSAQGMLLVLGSNTMIPGFEEGLLGANVSESRHLHLTFPAEYRAQQLAGKVAHFDITVKYIEEGILPEVDEDFCHRFNVHGGMEGLRKAVRETLEREAQSMVEFKLKQGIMNLVLDHIQAELPKVLVQEELMMLRMKAVEKFKKKPALEDLLEMPEDLYQKEAEQRVKFGLILSEVVRQHALKLDDDRLHEKIVRLSQAYDKPDEVVSWYYADKQRMASVEYVVLEDQAVEKLLELIQVETVATDYQALMQLAQSTTQGA